VERVIAEQGRLDFFFANAGIVGAKAGKSGEGGSVPRGLDETEGDEFVEVMRVNALGYVKPSHSPDQCIWYG
jgi:NAD(P)-dependent dehydrogenase (short-subunit alcohol dehydrogenase family)